MLGLSFSHAFYGLFIYLPGCESCEQIQSENFYGNSREMEEFLSNLLGETHKNVVLHIRKSWLHPKVSSS